jgi:hypothetical protein
VEVAVPESMLGANGIRLFDRVEQTSTGGSLRALFRGKKKGGGAIALSLHGSLAVFISCKWIGHFPSGIGMDINFFGSITTCLMR